MSAQTPARSLPAVIGPTENALRALLLRVLEATPLASYEQWVALNLVDRHPRPDDALTSALHQGLAIDHAQAGDVLRALEATGQLHRADGAWEVSPAGIDLLAQQRERVATLTAQLLDGIAEEDLATAVRVLDHVGARAREQRALLT